MGRFAKARQDLEAVPVVGAVVRRSKKLVLPGFQKIPLYDVMVFFFQSLGKGIVFQRAAALTYRIFVAMVPMVIALLSFISLVGPGLQQSFLEMTESFVPEYTWPAVSAIINDIIARQGGAFSSLMLVLSLYLTIVCINGLLAALNISYLNDKRRNLFRQILLSAGIMLLTFGMVILVAALFIGASWVAGYLHDTLMSDTKVYPVTVHVLKWLLTYVAIYFWVSIIYYLAPTRRANYRFFTAASSTCTILLLLLFLLVNIYFSNFSNYNLIYGSLGAVFAILLWTNWSSIILIICYDLNVSIAKAKEHKQSLPAEPPQHDDGTARKDPTRT